MAKNCYCDWNLVWWWFWIFGSGSDYVLSKIYGSGSDSDTIKIFRSGSDYQISISAQHCNTHLCICDILNHSQENFVIEIEKISWSRPNPFFSKMYIQIQSWSEKIASILSSRDPVHAHLCNTGQRWARIRTGLDWENICCFNVVILKTPTILVLIRFHRFAKL